MKSLNKRSVLAIGVGCFLGWAYYYFVGCSNGSCVISSNWYISIPYGGVLGYLFFGSFLRSAEA